MSSYIFMQVPSRRRQFVRPRITSTITRTTQSVSNTSGTHGEPFYGDGVRVGTVTEDLSPHGLGGISNRYSRADDVSRSETSLQEACNEVGIPLPPVLIHTFEELCWEARERRSGIVAIILNNGQRGELVEKLRALQRVMINCKNGDWLYWVAERSSQDGQKVLQLYGNPSINDDEVIIMAPSQRLNPVFVERIQASDAESQEESDSISERLNLLIQTLAAEREQLALWRSQRALQDMEYQQLARQSPAERTEHLSQENERKQDESDESSAEMRKKKKEEERKQDEREELRKIREARKARVTDPPPEGEPYIKIVIRMGDIPRFGRCFTPSATFQEVYDWVGSQDSVPRHFTLQRRDVVIRHTDPLEIHEVVDLREGDANEIKTRLETQVSFRYNIPSVNESLSSTVVDEQQESHSGITSSIEEIQKETEEEEEEAGERADQKEEGENTNNGDEKDGAKGDETTDEEEEMGDNEERKHQEGVEREGAKKKRRKKDKRTTSHRKKARKENN